MTVRVVTPPAYEPCTRAEFRAWARMEDDQAQAGIETMLIQAGRELAEHLTGRAFIPRTLQLVLPAWPCVRLDGVERIGFELPQPPLISVTSIQYVDGDGATQTLASDQYVVHTWREPGFVVPAWQVYWPALRAVPNAVQVTYRAGYSTSESPDDEEAYQAALPGVLRTWMEARAATLWRQREQLITGTIVQDLPRDFLDGLLDSLVVADRLFG